MAGWLSTETDKSACSPTGGKQRERQVLPLALPPSPTEELLTAHPENAGRGAHGVRPECGVGVATQLFCRGSRAHARTQQGLACVSARSKPRRSIGRRGRRALTGRGLPAQAPDEHFPARQQEEGRQLGRRRLAVCALPAALSQPPSGCGRKTHPGSWAASLGLAELLCWLSVSMIMVVTQPHWRATAGPIGSSRAVRN